MRKQIMKQNLLLSLIPLVLLIILAASIYPFLRKNNAPYNPDDVEYCCEIPALSCGAEQLRPERFLTIRCTGTRETERGPLAQLEITDAYTLHNESDQPQSIFFIYPNHSATQSIDSEIVDTDRVTLEAGASCTITYNWSTECAEVIELSSGGILCDSAWLQLDSNDLLTVRREALGRTLSEDGLTAFHTAEQDELVYFDVAAEQT